MYLFPESTPWENDFVVADKKNATFRNSFKNPFIYEFHGDSWKGFSQEKHKIMQSSSDENFITTELEKLTNKWRLISNQSLYNFIDSHLNTGECVEKYYVWHNHVNFDFDAPTSENTISLEEVLVMSLKSTILSIEERHKLTICKL